MNWYEAKGDPASRLRQRKHAWLRRFQIPPDALPGTLAQTYHRCGKPNCWCADGEGHPSWSLTFMADGKRHVEHIPEELVEQIRPLVEQGREFKDAVAEVFAANAQLLMLWRRQTTKKRRKKT
jgi:transposase InsO family protein